MLKNRTCISFEYPCAVRVTKSPESVNVTGASVPTKSVSEYVYS